MPRTKITNSFVKGALPAEATVALMRAGVEAYDAGWRPATVHGQARFEAAVEAARPLLAAQDEEHAGSGWS